MGISFELEAEMRSDLGKGSSRRLRCKDKVPAILFGGDESPMPLTLSHNIVAKALTHEAFFSHIINLKIDGKVQKAVIKDLQRHPYKPKIMHLDFQRIKATEAIIMNIPLHFVNEDRAVGVKAGGMINHLMTEIEIRCLPDNLPEYVEVDVLNLELGQSLHLSDLKIPQGVEILALIHGEEHDHPVVSINLNRGATEEEEETTTAEAAEAATATTDAKAQPATAGAAPAKGKEK